MPFELLVFTCAAVGAGNSGLLPLATLVASCRADSRRHGAGGSGARLRAGNGAHATTARPQAFWLVSARRRNLRGVTALPWAPVLFEQMSKDDYVDLQPPDHSG
jgi:hypothetical protein